ncbi:YihY/virulence factor BrkB family protein [Flavobacteriaceae bacterium TP-CH-4]|uniref:YihY/virulence factor BrkB family protein n=1 Tax=Pelagihabitans pacificus TaxID=2696054 RepID=A0A967AXD6_9FLAO|nr:YihY/virulence factor BrkB family protein [Pelagihabitans pacificus]NHF59352.1 YihY/virulence factor BrkB family protein [Pelagihabitans pacificus]
MSVEIEKKLERIPVVNWIVKLLKTIKLPGFEGLSIYDLSEMYIRGIVQGALSTRASSIAFSLFIAIFPLLIFMVTLVPFLVSYISLENANFDAEFLSFLESFLPTATGEYFGDIYQQIKDQKRGGLLSSSFLISIFLMANGVNAIFGGFENSYHVNLTRNFFRQYLYALMVGLILSILIIVGFVAFVYFEVYVLGYLKEFAERTSGSVLGEDEVIGVQIAKFLFFIILSYLTTATLYYFGTLEGKQARFFSAGALMTTILFILTSYLFGVYVEKFARYNELYGALGGLMILMIYIWLNSNILLLGFELNASLNWLRKNYNKDADPD